MSSNVRGRWRLVPHGSILQKALISFMGVAGFSVPPAASVFPSSAKREEAPASAGARDDGVMAPPKHVFPFGVVQVFNERTKTVHLSPGEGTACTSWRCGSVASPVNGAEFAHGTQRWSPELNPFRFCLGCYGTRGLKKLGATLQIAGEEIAPSEASASESDSDSAESLP